jgi:hypothetical protein
MSVLSGKNRISGVTVGIAWLATIVTGTFLLLAYSNSPGAPGSPPENWPQSSEVPRDTERPTLVMFIHPHCPCSRASIDELAQVMAHCQGRVSANVLFLRPTEMATDWVLTDTWREAGRIPGVTVRRDDEGREARLFGAQTSGDTALYDAKGQLLFHGGITISRGHSGDNLGHDTVQALLLGEPAPRTNTPAFGCSLFECNKKDVH